MCVRYPTNYRQSRWERSGIVHNDETSKSAPSPAQNMSWFFGLWPLPMARSSVQYAAAERICAARVPFRVEKVKNRPLFAPKSIFGAFGAGPAESPCRQGLGRQFRPRLMPSVLHAMCRLEAAGQRSFCRAPVARESDDRVDEAGMRQNRLHRVLHSGGVSTGWLRMRLSWRPR